MNRIFYFEFNTYQWISETEKKTVEQSDILVIDVPDEFTESLDIYRFAKNHFLQNQEKRIAVDVTRIHEMLKGEAIKHTKYRKIPLDLTGLGLILKPHNTGWYWFRPRKNNEKFFHGSDAIQIYVVVENEISKFGFHSNDDFHNCDELDGYFEEIKSAEKAAV